MLVSEFDYPLPPELIAQHPAPERTASRLLRLEGASGALEDLRFADLTRLVAPNDVVVLNDTRVIKARLGGRKRTGGKIEVFIERIIAPHEALAMIRASHPPAIGAELVVGPAVPARVIGREDDLYRLRFLSGITVEQVLERHGTVPLPPYITHTPVAEDTERYQTVYADKPGAVAAPTAGLHFDQTMLAALAAKGVRIATVTLHVGAGTFQPVRAENVEDHRMHRERFNVPKEAVAAVEAARAAGGRVLAVGSTSLRALEAAAASGKLEPLSGETDLFIHPAYAFRVTERLLTNFHLPKSSLLMLVSAFGGAENVRNAYAHAIAQGYRFFSYGDAMLIERNA
ncbi:MAG: tRNA preQ1(34) S-adenosylmethionine ribosyltransferase-isomerase QueA [Betaproteobacteria bacterium]|nr:tRNA preQ1(34) S-adenosylmethionine ribosyltransferase-isomerase QueA [Betaproteobacteria bacterium]